MFGRHVRMPTDLVLGAAAGQEEGSVTEWVGRHHQRLHFAYEQVSQKIRATGEKNKRLYDRTAREAPLLPGERVLVRDNRRQGKGKLSDRWEATPYVVCRQQRPGQPVYTIRPEGKAGPERVVHRNMIRPCPNYPEVTEEVVAEPAPTAPWMEGWAVVPGLPVVAPPPAAPGEPELAPEPVEPPAAQRQPGSAPEPAEPLAAQRQPEVVPEPAEPDSPVRRSQRENRGRPPSRYGEWTTQGHSRDWNVLAGEDVTG
nr:basic proline-rich protein-like [Misgurnus anguillicaudatus]